MLRLGAIHRPAPPAIQPLHTRTGAALMSAAPRNWFLLCPSDGDMLANDSLGDCVPVADFRYIETVLANSAGSNLWKPTLNAILARYSLLTGFDPITGTPDIGTDTSADLVAFCRDGIALPELQRVIVPVWTSVDPKRLDHVAAALAIAPCLVTLNLPVDFTDIEDDHDAWQGDPGPLSGDCHRVLLGNVRTFRTWGFDVVVSVPWWDACVVAVDCMIVPDECGTDLVDFAALEADAKALT
jgi:hypothetical protein